MLRFFHKCFQIFETSSWNCPILTHLLRYLCLLFYEILDSSRFIGTITRVNTTIYLWQFDVVHRWCTRYGCTSWACIEVVRNEKSKNIRAKSIRIVFIGTNYLNARKQNYWMEFFSLICVKFNSLRDYAFKRWIERNRHSKISLSFLNSFYWWWWWAFQWVMPLFRAACRIFKCLLSPCVMPDTDRLWSRLERRTRKWFQIV